MSFGTFGAFELSWKHDFLFQNSPILELSAPVSLESTCRDDRDGAKTRLVRALRGMVFTTEFTEDTAFGSEAQARRESNTCQARSMTTRRSCG